MKLFEIANGNQRTQKISEEDFVDILEHHCAQAVININYTPIYRGINTAAFGKQLQLKVGDSTVGAPRVSKNTKNYYTLWVDNSKEWKDFPKRSRSFICSTSRTYADDFGEVYLVIPYDNAQIGICPESDYWYSFDIIDDLSSLNSLIDNISSIFLDLEIGDMDINDMDPSDFDFLLSFLETINVKNLKVAANALESKITSATIKKQINYIREAELLLSQNNVNDFTEVMEKVLSPKHFKKSTGESFNETREVECFIGGKALFMPLNFSGAEQYEILKKYLDDNDLNNILSLFKKKY